MAFGKLALDVLNRTREIQEYRDFCNEDGGLTEEIHSFVRSLEGPLRSRLNLDQWNRKIEYGSAEEPPASSIYLNLFPPNWYLPGDDFISIGFSWCNPFDEEPDEPCVYVRVPTSDVFPERDQLLELIRPSLVKIGFEDYLSSTDASPYHPLWNYVSLTPFESPAGFNIDAFVTRVVEIVRGLLSCSGLIDQVLKSRPEEAAPLPATDRPLKMIAFVDTETSGTGSAARMTEFAVVNAVYDEIGDRIVGVLEEYNNEIPQKLDPSRVRSMMERAAVIVAHNAEFDRGVLERELPGTGKKQWLCSLHGIDWKSLNGSHSQSLEALLGVEGLCSGQEHHACADAHDLLRLMAVQRDGKTYLARLLSNPRSISAAASK